MRRARRILDEDTAKAIREREDAIARRARHLAEQAVKSRQTWAKGFGPPPTNPAIAEAWWERLATIAAYRDRWRVGGSTILGDEASVGSTEQAGPTLAAPSAAVDRGIDI